MGRFAGMMRNKPSSAGMAATKPHVALIGGLLLGASLVQGCGQSSSHEPPSYGHPATLLGEDLAFLVVYRQADAWPKDKPVPEEPGRAHSRYLLSLYRAGRLKFAGRFGDGSGGGMFFTARDQASAMKTIEADPAVIAGIFDFDLRPWLLSDWEQRAQTWPQ